MRYLVAVLMLASAAALAQAQKNEFAYETIILDDVKLTLGTSGDFSALYDEAVNNRLEIVDSDDNLVLHVTDAGSTIAVVLIGSLSATTLSTSSAFTAGEGADTVHRLGRWKIGYNGSDADMAAIAHEDRMNSSDYALLQNAWGETILNSRAGQVLHLRIGDSTTAALTLDADGVDITDALDVAGAIAANGAAITTDDTTFALVNTTATTVNFAGGATTTVNIGNAAGTIAIAGAATVGGSLAANGAAITTNDTTFGLLDATATTINFGGAATTIDIGAATGTTTVKNNLMVDGTLTSSGSYSPGVIDLGDGNGTILFGADDDIQVGYDEAGEDRLEWDDGTYLLMSLKNNANVGDLTLTGAAAIAGLLTADSAQFGGGYGNSGSTFSTTGTGQFNGAVTSSSAVTGATGVIAGVADTTQGVFTAYANATTAGGKAIIHVGPNLDTQTDTWVLTTDTTTGDLELSGVGGTSALGEILIVDETTGLTTFPHAVNVTGSYLAVGGTISVTGAATVGGAIASGADDTTAGSLAAYGNATTSGGKVYIYNAAGEDHADYEYFVFEAIGNSLTFGPNSDTDVVKLSTAGGLVLDGSLTISGDIIYDSGLAAAITFDGSQNVSMPGDLAVNGDNLNCDGDLTITPAGGDLNVVGELNATLNQNAQTQNIFTNTTNGTTARNSILLVCGNVNGFLQAVPSSHTTGVPAWADSFVVGSDSDVFIGPYTADDVWIQTGGVGTKRIGVTGAGVTNIGDAGTTNYASFSVTGDLSFAGSAGLYPRTLAQTTEPAAGTGATQIDSGEVVVWVDTDDSNAVFLVYNYSGTVVTVALT